MAFQNNELYKNVQKQISHQDDQGGKKEITVGTSSSDINLAVDSYLCSSHTSISV